MNIKSAVLKISTSFLLITALFSLSACNQSAAGASAKLSEDEAKAIALEDCGLQETEIKNKKSALDTEDGVLVYEIEFYSDTHEYEYEIDANSGKIMKKSKEVYSGPIVQTVPEVTDVSTAAAETPTAATTETLAEATAASTSADVTEFSEQMPQIITLEQAKAIALSDAGVSENGVTFTEQKQETENGSTVFEIEFYTDASEYEYEIGTQGNIIKKEVTPFGSSPSNPPSSASPYISADEAISKALAHAGLDRTQVFGIETELDTDDGIAVYEVQFQKGNIEYEYKIDASSGAVIEFETDIED